MLRPARAVLILLALFAGETALRAAPSSETEEGQPAPAAPVWFRGETLFAIRAPLGRLSASDRALAIVRRIDEIASGPSSIIQHIRTVERDDRVDVVAGDRLVLSVTDADALPTGRTRRQMAADDARTVASALARDFRDRSLRGLAFGALYSIGSTLALALVLWGLSWAFRRFYMLLRRISIERIGRVTRLLFVGGVGELLVGVARLIRLVITAVILYLYVNLTLSFFPWSRGAAQQLFAYLRSATDWMVHGVVGYLPNLVYIAIIVPATYYLVKFARLVFEALERGAFKVSGFYPDWAMPTFKIVRFLILAFAVVIVFPYLPGSSSPAFKGVSVFLGILFSLGSASAIGNLISGLVLTYMRPFQTGDRVRVADTIGDLVGKNLLVVRVRTIKNVEVTIPNAVVLANHIINYSTCAKETGLILHETVTIGYDAPWRRVHELLLGAAAKTDGISKTPAPFVFQTALDDFYVHYEINAYTDRPNDMAPIHSELRARIQDAFNEAGMEIMSPHFTSARDGNRRAIPDQYLPQSYEAPSFRILPTDSKPRK